MIYIFIILLFSLCLSSNDTMNVVNQDAWKMNLVPIAGVVPIGQLENNKPIKAITIASIRAYWLKELKESKKNNDIGDRNRSVWWLLFLYFYATIDAYVDSHIDEVPKLINDDKLNKME